MHTIDFDDTTTVSVAKGFYEFSKPNRFSVLKMEKGHGKTAVATATCGEYAKQLRETGYLKEDEPLHVIVVAPKSVLLEKSWNGTIDQYNEQKGNLLYLKETFTTQGLAMLQSNQSKLRNTKDILVKVKNKLMKEARTLSEETGQPLMTCYQSVAKKHAEHSSQTIEQIEKALVKKEKEKIKKNTMSDFISRNQHPTIIIIDEVQDFKDSKSLRGKAMKQITANFPKVLGLSAQPAPNNALDYVAYAVYGGFYTSHSDFLKKHITERAQTAMRLAHTSPCGEDGNFIPTSVMDIDTFFNHVNEVIYVPQLETTFSMPTKISCEQFYTLTGETEKEIRNCLLKRKRREYDTFQACMSDIRSAIAGDMNHLRQIPIFFNTFKKRGIPMVQPLIFYQYNRELGDDPKQKNEFDPEFEKGILWALWKCGVDYHIINGKHKYNQQMQKETNKAIVIQYKSGGAGLNFPESNATLFYGLTYSWKDMEQAEGRNIRRNHSHDVFQNTVCSTNEADKAMLDIIKSKQDFTSRVQKEYIEKLEKQFRIGE